MEWLDLKGRSRRVVVADYLINWDGPSLSKFQWRVKQWLKPYWSQDLVMEEAPCVGTRMSVDLINVSRKVAIEIQGSQHTAFNPFMHNGSLASYRSQIKRDLRKGEWCERNGFKLIEVLPQDTLTVEWFAARDVYL